MKNALMVLAILIMVCAAGTVTLGQTTQKPGQEIVGKWNISNVYDPLTNKNDATGVYEFNKDGSMECNSILKKGYAAEKGTWEVKADSLIITFYEGHSTGEIKNGNKSTIVMTNSVGSLNSTDRILRFHYKVDNDSLTMTNKKAALRFKREK